MNRVSRDPAYSLLRHSLTASTGLEFRADRDQELAALIDERLSHLLLHDCSAYADFLANNPASAAEKDVLIERLTIGETYFFRDPEQFAAIRDIILPDILERKRFPGPLRIWSAGCAAGAEPYSLAILLKREMAARLAGWQIAIEATDLNASSLTQAAAGKFRAWALRSTSDDVKRECFSKEGQSWTIHPRFRQSVSFHCMNLAGSEFSTPPNTGTGFDLILCRNVMIYLAPEALIHLIARLHQSLEEGGWLVVGAAEYNTERFKAFRTVSAAGASLYQKMVPAQGGQRDAAASAAPVRALPKAPAAAADVEGLRQLADRGDWKNAAEYGQRLLAADRLNPILHFYQALIFEKLGVTGESARCLRQAIYLDRGFAMAHYHLGLRLKQDRQESLAARSFGNVLRVLDCTPDDANVLAGDGVTVTALKELARMHLENRSGS